MSSRILPLLILGLVGGSLLSDDMINSILDDICESIWPAKER